MSLTPRDIKRLEGVHADLVAVVRRASQIWATLHNDYTLSVGEGLRTKERQAALYAQGRTAPGKVVTWTMDSKHLTGHAVDLILAKNGVVPWNDVAIWEALADCMTDAGLHCGVRIRWGGDWNGNGKREKGEGDLVHFEIGGEKT